MIIPSKTLFYLNVNTTLNKLSQGYGEIIIIYPNTLFCLNVKTKLNKWKEKIKKKKKSLL